MRPDSPNIHAIGIELDAERLKAEPQLEALPIIPTRDFVLFPGMTFPITLARQKSLATAKQAYEDGEVVGIVCQRDPSIEDPGRHDLYDYGVFADILQVIELPDDSHTAIVRSRGRFEIEKDTGMFFKEYQRLKVIPRDEIRPRRIDKEFIMVLKQIKDTMGELMEHVGHVPDELKHSIENTDEPEDLLNLIGTYAPFGADFKASLIAEDKIKERGFMVLTELAKNEGLMAISKRVHQRTRARLEENQRQAFLQAQLESVREELYGPEKDDVERLRAKALEANLPEELSKRIESELSKLERLSPQSADYSVQYTYLETLLSLPWTVADTPNADFALAERELEADHYGLEKVKDRILEQIAVVMSNPGSHAPIICLVGAPGVGKTSLGESVARALGRRYSRVSLGGLHDEAELRGHRRTYIGAMPGRIIEALRRAGSNNPVLLLDEIDKVGSDSFKGDPAAALLEVLDPEQNCRFHDNYVDIDFDLSGVMFIATANTLEGVSRPLIDRMEVIDIDGYLVEEKIEIARRHLLPRLLKRHGVSADELTVTDEAIKAIVEGYTSESGVRQLDKQLATIVRRSLLRRMRAGSEGTAAAVVVTPDNLTDYLRAPRYLPERFDTPLPAGVANGLAWTAAGGQMLTIEASLAPAKTFALELTGNLGTVMRESATIAAQWVKAHAAELGIDEKLFENHSLSVHAPEGAVPKDGPSAGITIVSAIVSACLNRPLRHRLAMTGEVTLSGRVLPVGGIREKVLAARRNGITDIILPAPNRKDVDEIPARYLEGVTFHYVDKVADVIRLSYEN